MKKTFYFNYCFTIYLDEIPIYLKQDLKVSHYNAVVQIFVNMNCINFLFYKKTTKIIIFKSTFIYLKVQLLHKGTRYTYVVY